jgi:hypothetical protein
MKQTIILLMGLTMTIFGSRVRQNAVNSNYISLNPKIHLFNLN